MAAFTIPPLITELIDKEMKEEDEGIMISEEEYSREMFNLHQSYKITIEENKALNEPAEVLVLKEIEKKIKECSNENLMNYNYIFQIMNTIQVDYMVNIDPNKEKIKDEEYRRYSNLVVALHKLQEDVTVKGIRWELQNEFVERIKAGKITIEQNQKRADVISKAFDHHYQILNYLVGKLNNDFMSFGFVLKDDGDKIEMNLAIPNDLYKRAKELLKRTVLLEELPHFIRQFVARYMEEEEEEAENQEENNNDNV